MRPMRQHCSGSCTWSPAFAWHTTAFLPVPVAGLKQHFDWVRTGVRQDITWDCSAIVDGGIFRYTEVP